MDVSVLGSSDPFTYLFGVTVCYNTREVDLHSQILYSWEFIRFLHLHGVVVNTTSPLLNHTFEANCSYKYRLWVSNAVSTFYTKGMIEGIYCYYAVYDFYIMVLLFAYCNCIVRCWSNFLCINSWFYSCFKIVMTYIANV